MVEQKQCADLIFLRTITAISLVAGFLFFATDPAFSQTQTQSSCQEAGYSSGSPGKVKFRVLNADLRISEHETSEFKEARNLISFVRISSGSALLEQEKLFQACVGLSAAGESFQSNRLSYFPLIEKGPEWTVPLSNSPTAATFKVQCLDKMPPPEDKARLENILSQFPETYPFNSWKARLDKRMAACQDQVAQFCRHVDSGKSEASIRTMTAQCQIKNLTQNQLRDTHLLKTLSLCSEAIAYGYHWTPQDPPLSKDCRMKKGKVKLK